MPGHLPSCSLHSITPAALSTYINAAAACATSPPVALGPACPFATPRTPLRLPSPTWQPKSLPPPLCQPGRAHPSSPNLLARTTSTQNRSSCLRLRQDDLLSLGETPRGSDPLRRGRAGGVRSEAGGQILGSLFRPAPAVSGLRLGWAPICDRRGRKARSGRARPKKLARATGSGRGETAAHLEVSGATAERMSCGLADKRVGGWAGQLDRDRGARRRGARLTVGGGRGYRAGLPAC